jgi:hypothetical protein
VKELGERRSRGAEKGEGGVVEGEEGGLEGGEGEGGEDVVETGKVE